MTATAKADADAKLKAASAQTALVWLGELGSRKIAIVALHMTPHWLQLAAAKPEKTKTPGVDKYCLKHQGASAVLAQDQIHFSTAYTQFQILLGSHRNVSRSCHWRFQFHF